MKRTIVLLSAALLASACTPNAGTRTYLDESGVPVTDTYRFHLDMEAMADTLAKEGYNIQLLRLEDTRRADAHGSDREDNVILEYQADKLMRGLQPYMEASLRRHLSFSDNQKNPLTAEISVTDVHTLIRTGDFMSGSMGKYVVGVSGNVIVRDKTSRVVVNEEVTSEYEARRHDYKGRQNDSAVDEKRMMQAVDQGMKKFAVDVAWAARRNISELPWPLKGTRTNLKYKQEYFEEDYYR